MKQHTIALVETDILIRYPLAHYLRECGYRVLEAANPEEARRLVATEDVTIELFLIDIASLGEAGFALAQELRNANKDRQVLTIGSVKKAVEVAAGLCEDGPQPSRAADHEGVLALIQSRMLARNKRSA